MAYAEISSEHLKYIQNAEFGENTKITLDTVTMYFQTYEECFDEGVHQFNQIFIESNEVGGYSMRHIVTHPNPNIWASYRRKHSHSTGVSKRNTLLTEDEMQKLIIGSKYRRRTIDTNYHYSDDDETDMDDPDYIPSDTGSESGSENSDFEITDVKESTLTNVTVASTGQSCIKRILRHLQTIENKHNWKCVSVDMFLKQYLSNKLAISKLFLYKMDIINSEMQSTFGKELFKKSDLKSIRMDKICKQLKKLPQLFE